MSLEFRGGWSQRELASSSRGGLCSIFFSVFVLFRTLAWALRTMFVCGARALETMNHGNVVVVQMQPIATVSQLSNMFFVCMGGKWWREGGPGAPRGRFSYTRTHESGRGNSDVYTNVVANCTIHKIMNLAICKVHKSNEPCRLQGS